MPAGGEIMIERRPFGRTGHVSSASNAALPAAGRMTSFCGLAT